MTNRKSILLFFIAIGGLLIFYNIPTYNRWLHGKIFTICNIPGQLEHTTTEERREIRYGYSYLVFKNIAGKLGKEGNATLLLPPDSYLAAMGVDMKMVEPALYYYYTGMNAVTVNSPKVWMASWALLPEEKGHLAVVKFKSRRYADSLITFFKKFPQP